MHPLARPLGWAKLRLPMVRVQNRLSGNAPGEFFVDDACIDCKTCRIVVPEVFVRSEALGMSVVCVQPRSDHGALRAKLALVACPTRHRDREQARPARRGPSVPGAHRRERCLCIAHEVNPRAYLHEVVHCIVHGWPQNSFATSCLTACSPLIPSST